MALNYLPYGSGDTASPGHLDVRPLLMAALETRLSRFGAVGALSTCTALDGLGGLPRAGAAKAKFETGCLGVREATGAATLVLLKLAVRAGQASRGQFAKSEGAGAAKLSQPPTGRLLLSLT